MRGVHVAILIPHKKRVFCFKIKDMINRIEVIEVHGCLGHNLTQLVDAQSP